MRISDGSSDVCSSDLGGLLPGAKVSAEIAATRCVPQGVDCLSPPGHSAFSTPIELIEFAARMRMLSGGKPVGIKLCVGYPHELFAVMKAMLETGITIDFIVIDGAERSEERRVGKEWGSTC